MSSVKAFAMALLIVAYFVLVTVWLPNRILNLASVQSMERNSQDLITTIVWAAGLVVGMAALRVAQERGSI